jgi:hypothetical protein
VFAAWLEDDVRRCALLGRVTNIVLRDVLGGRGGTSSPRLDPQCKSYAAILLELPVSVPALWERDAPLAPERPGAATAASVGAC